MRELDVSRRRFLSGSAAAVGGLAATRQVARAATPDPAAARTPEMVDLVLEVNGRRINSCLTLAARCQGKAITTIEGLARDGELHPMQAAFLERDGLQCGYCTPGQIMSAVALVEEGRAVADAAIREWMSGNICRCGAYPHILAAIKDTAKGA